MDHVGISPLSFADSRTHSMLLELVAEIASPITEYTILFHATGTESELRSKWLYFLQ